MGIKSSVSLPNSSSGRITSFSSGIAGVSSFFAFLGVGFAGAGVELIKHLQVGFNYALGLTDDYSASKLELNGKNRGWSITAAILF